MRRFLILAVVLPLLSFTIGNDNSNFIGKWEGKDENKIGYFVFDAEGYVTIGIGGETMGGKEFEKNGKRGRMTYEINSDTDPVEIDITVTDLDTSMENKLLCIARFIDKDTMMLALSFEGARPAEFNSDNSIILNRIE